MRGHFFKAAFKSIFDAFGYELKRKKTGPSEKAQGYLDVSIDDFDFKCNLENRHFWRRVLSNDWESETFAILKRYLRPELTFYDVGAWIGPTTLYASALCHRVIAFEPDTSAYRHLLHNLELNQIQNVTSFNVALAQPEGIRPAGSFGGYLGDSMTSLVYTPDVADVPMTQFVCLNLEQLIERLELPVPDFIKIDIEGGEFDLLPAISDLLLRFRPVLYLSLHEPYLPEAEREAAMNALVVLLEPIYTTLTPAEDFIRPGEPRHLPIQSMLDSEWRGEFSAFVLHP